MLVVSLGSAFMTKFSDKEAMALAIAEAKKGLGFVEPNPAVGCVILSKNRELLATGYHRQFGKAHAEIEALKNIHSRQDLKGAHIYVTLEPCSHYGKTPPCAETLSQLPIASLTYGRIDPNPDVNKKGLSVLKRAGIKVKKYKDETRDILELTDMFAYAFKNKQSFISLKIASTLDGQIGMKSGESQWITGEEARTFAHELRARHSAVLVGRRTVELDNPTLNVRHPKFRSWRSENKIVILDPQGKLLSKISKLNISKGRTKDSIFVVTSNHVKSNSKFDKAFNHLQIPKRGKSGLCLETLKSKLFTLGIQSVLVEGGAHTVNRFLEQKQANKLYLFLAPSILGAQNGLSWTPNLSIKKLSQKIELEDSSITNVGSDYVITSYFKGALV